MKNDHPPILIASPTRSGTTMIAGLLYHHGVWIGEAKVTKAPETNPLLGTENTKIKAYLKSLDIKISPVDFRREILSLVETDGPWLVKTAQNLLKWKKWNAAFPEAKWILPNRSMDEIVRSAMRHPGMRNRGPEEQTRRVELLKGLQEEVARRCENTLWLCPGKIARKQPEETARLFDFCDLALDYDVWDNWIEPERWHGD